MEQRTARKPDHASKAGSARGSRNTTRPRGGPDIPLMEWVAASIGLALVSATIACMIYQGLTRGSSPPDVSVQAEAIVQLRDGYVVTIRAMNRGDTTAADIKVEGRLESSSGVAETSEMTFQYLPPNSERKGGMFFAKDPRQFTLKLAPKGYETP